MVPWNNGQAAYQENTVLRKKTQQVTMEDLMCYFISLTLASKYHILNCIMQGIKKKKKRNTKGKTWIK